MANEGYVTFNSIIERINRDKPENVVYKIADAKEWLWEAIKKIGGESAYLRGVEELAIEDGRVLIPNYIQAVRSVKGENGEILAQTYDSLDDDIINVDKYIINGRYIFTNYGGSKLCVETLTFPKDEQGNPLVINNIDVISAVCSYILERITRKYWAAGKIADKVYYAFEKEWLFYVRAAINSLSIPSMDSMEDWRMLHNMIPGLNENYATKRGGNNTSYPQYV